MLPSSKNVECGALAHMLTNKKPPQTQVYLHLWENSSRIRYGRLLTLRPGLQQAVHGQFSTRVVARDSLPLYGGVPVGERRLET